ncbi:hypothetical protein ACH5RR_001731 [Cinchona calisaya]|uniref:Uncharacterized protein n=1 Tax=Cinchona calisaya TaxID=153742 RepID=A0ABD3B492_9GENT
MSEMGWYHQITVCYDVHDKLLFRIPDVLNFCNERPVFVDGDFLFTTKTTRLLAFGMLSLDKDKDEDEDEDEYEDEDEVEEDQEEEEEDRHKPWFSVTVEDFSDTSGRLPPGFIDYIRENGSVIDDLSSFSLLRIAPLKYATLWSTKQEKSCIRLSVFTVLPPSASRKGDPPIMHSNIEISDEHLKLEEFVAFSIEAAIAV